MDPLRAIAEQHGVFLCSEALAIGHDHRTIRAEVKAGRWVRLRRGAYTFADLYEPLDATGRHRTRSRAVLRALGDRVALSHVSAALEHGCTTWDVDLSRIHVTRLDGGAGRTERDVVHHEGFCLGDDVVRSEGGLLAMKAPRAVLETATQTSVESGLVTLDDALHRKLVTGEELRDQFALMQKWPFAQHVQLTLRLADGRAESPGESRGRHLFWAYGLPAPVLQFAVHDASGRLVGISDWAWPEHGLLGEFDGKVKYGRLLRPGQESGDAVFEEKRREDLLRETTGWGMFRMTWGDLYQPAETVRRLRTHLRLVA